jgi:hypothetical protein
MSLAAFASFALSEAPPQAKTPAPPPADPVTERFDAMQRDIEALREKTARQDDQIERLKAENDEKWLTEQRAAQIRGIVGDVLGDSAGRASLRTDGALAGYDRNFFIASADGNFRLNFEGQLQTRFAFSFLPREAVSGNPPNLGQVQNEYGFELRRVKLNFFGHMFDPSWQYRIQFAYERDGQNVNVQMLRQCDAATYLGAERPAEIDRIGVWSVPGGITRPWDFRRRRSPARSGGTS